MARKSSRDKGQRIRLSEAQMRRPGVDNQVKAEADAAAPSPDAQTGGLAQEYHYVLADLRRIGLIAVVMLGALVALALLLA